MVKRINITIKEWIFDEFLSKEKNRSALIERLLIKHFLPTKKVDKNG